MFHEWPAVGQENPQTWYGSFRPIADISDLAHVEDMQVRIFEADTLVGEADVYGLDPPMGVAMAKFSPTAAYEITRHANVVDGEYIADRSDILRVETPSGLPVLSQSISIQDFPTLGEREVYLFGIFEPSFDELFREHPDFKAYRNAG